MEGNSRLIVKGLPSRITEKRLRELFSSHGTVTDCQLKYRPDGKFRKFAFIGFASDAEAISAMEYYDKTFIDTTRIQVKLCRKMGEANAMKKKAEDGKVVVSTATNNKSLVVEISGYTAGTKKKSLLQFFAPLKPKRIRISRTESSALIFLSKQSEVQSLLRKNGKFFGGCKVSVKAVSADDERIGNRKEEWGKESVGRRPTTTATRDENVERIAETGRLFVRNLPYVSTVEEIETVFKPYGPLADVKLPMVPVFDVDGGAKKPKGIALIAFVFPEHALKAYSELDGTVYKGRMLHILPGEEKREGEAGREQSQSSSFKRKKAAELKSSAHKSHNWNALFLSSNAVADVVTDRLETEKSAMLDVEQNKASVGVRMALAETTLVRETREFLLEQGVNLDSFSRPDSTRSKTIILVKNLPANASLEEIRSKFEKFGAVGRVVLPPSGISALVEFMDQQEAKRAFTSLAYSRFKTAPLYLEWAPVDALHQPIAENTAHESKVESRADEGGQEEDEDDATLFVKNLNFDTTDDQLRGHFEWVGPVVYASVAKKRTAVKAESSGGVLSMGFGFVRYRRRADAKRALKELQGRTLDGFALQLKLSERQLGDEREVGKKRTRTASMGDDQSMSDTKILVRNVPFQANQDELASLFQTFGRLRFVRLPKKGSSSGHRGFAFVDFVSKSDAKKAYDALRHSTHLYGRRLVLEWASTVDDTVQDLQRKVTSGATGRRKETKKSKLIMPDEHSEQ